MSLERRQMIALSMSTNKIPVVGCRLLPLTTLSGFGSLDVTKRVANVEK